MSKQAYGSERVLYYSPFTRDTNNTFRGTPVANASSSPRAFLCLLPHHHPLVSPNPNALLPPSVGHPIRHNLIINPHHPPISRKLFLTVLEVVARHQPNRAILAAYLSLPPAVVLVTRDGEDVAFGESKFLGDGSLVHVTCTG